MYVYVLYIYILYILMTVKVSYVYHVLWCFITGVLGVIGVFKVWFLALLMWITGHHWTAWSWETYERNHLGCWSLWFQRGEFYLVARFRARYIYIHCYMLCIYILYIYIACSICLVDESWWVMMSPCFMHCPQHSATIQRGWPKDWDPRRVWMCLDSDYPTQSTRIEDIWGWGSPWVGPKS